MTAEEVSRKYKIDLQTVEAAIERAKRATTPVDQSIRVVERGKEITLNVTRNGVGILKVGRPHVVEGKIKTQLLDFFYHFDFVVPDKWRKYSVIVKARLNEEFVPDIFPHGPVLLRIDSGCETGQLFGDMTCECKEQLDQALDKISGNGSGMVINIPHQDGRGMGLPFKLATLSLQQELKVDTVESAALLEPNLKRDVRTFAGAIAILRFLGASNWTPIRLLSNNPKKLDIFTENGFTDACLVSHTVPPTEDTRMHLEAKQHKLGHVNLVETAGPES